ncbi:MAG: diguanylate cyclase [Myxococcales bacterium]|nr:diguanylate cyclase [Myxococcales bacterium]
MRSVPLDIDLGGSGGEGGLDGVESRTPERVLVADDDPVTRTLVAGVLRRWGFDVTACADGDSAWQELSKEDAPDLAVLDWVMPGIQGPELCELLRRRARYTYVILLTGRTSQEDVLAGMRAGADDYLRKPVDLATLEVRMRAGLRIVRLQARLLEMQDRLVDLASHDALTGVLNRRAGIAALSRELNRARRDGRDLALLMCDIDHFKCINDAHGHLAGDDVLREVCGRMGAELRNYDNVGRYGGEEFIVVLPGCGVADALAVAERLRAAIAAPAINTQAGPVPVTASFGVAAASGADGADRARSAHALIARADAALYVAKEQGRDRVVGPVTRAAPCGCPQSAGSLDSRRMAE